MSASKEALLSRLLQPESAGSSSGKPANSLIQEVGGDSKSNLVSEVLPPPAAKAVVATPPPAEDSGPSILEMMMAAQREANAEKEKDKAIEQTVASTKPLGGGFKKGFFGGGGGSAPKKSAETKKAAPAGEVLEVKKATDKKSNPLVFDDVQKAMEEDQHPLLKQLKQNDWITPDLAQQFQSNAILSRGFKDPKCMAAMQLLQKNPKEAQQKFQNDPDVSRFLQEFGKMMAGHFEGLAAQQAGASAGGSSGSGGVGSNSGAAKSSSGVTELSADGIRISAPSSAGAEGSGAGKIQEIGPLHAQVLQKKQQQQQASAPAPVSTSKAVVPSTNNSSNNKSATSAADEEERVKQDEELRTMLMDPELQRILLECGDPAKFQQHMRNPDTYRKIVRLQKAGLVGTAR